MPHHLCYGYYSPVRWEDIELTINLFFVSQALELHNTELLRRPIGVDLAEEKGEYTYSRR